MSALPFVSDTFGPTRWCEVGRLGFTDTTYHRGISRGPEADSYPEGAGMPVVHIAFSHLDIRNASRPDTIDEPYCALDHTHQNSPVAAVILAGNGPPTRDGGYSFCSGGGQRVRGRDDYRYEVEDTDPEAAAAQHREQIGPACAGRLHILEVQRLIRTMSKVTIATVSGWATSDGHSLDVVVDLSAASVEYAAFMQVDTNVGSFDAGYDLALLVRQAGDRRACEIFFFAERYDVETAKCQDVINQAVPHIELEEITLEWAAIITIKSPRAIRILKFASSLADDGPAGQQVFTGKATRVTYVTAGVQEGRDVFLEHRAPHWEDYPYYY